MFAGRTDNNCLALAIASSLSFARIAATPDFAAFSAVPAPAVLSSAVKGAVINSSDFSVIMTTSAIQAIIAAVPAQRPSTTAIWGTAPESAALILAISPYAPSVFIPSLISPPFESKIPITGAPFLSASS